VSKWVFKKRFRRGGQAEIWLVEDSVLGTEFVAKRLLPDWSDADEDHDPNERLRRLQREVRIQRDLSYTHPGIMPITSTEFDAEPPYFVMPRATESLGDLMRRCPGRMSPDLATQIILTACDAIGYAHSRFVLHRDISPGNIMLLKGRWVVGDFGFSLDRGTDSTTFTRTHHNHGTLAYMAPEQYDNAHEVGPEADVHALGRLLYHMLTGVVPFPRPPVIDLLPAEFQHVVAKAMAPEPRDRYRQVIGFSGMLRASALGWRHRPPVPEIRTTTAGVTEPALSSVE
jgi:eukaryotic-like serine/threonine-protein kinase